MNSRIEALTRMLETRPDDTRARFGLALEYERLGRWDEVIAHLQEYLGVAQDEGNGYGRLARALKQAGRGDEAREAYRLGIAAAGKHGHPTMAVELEEELDDM